MTDQIPYRLHQSLGYQLSLTSRIQERRFEENLKTLGLTRITWCILLAVNNESLTQPSDIASFVGIDRTATSRALRQMEQNKTLFRATGKGDKRTTSVALTDKGKNLVALGTNFARENAAKLESKLTKAEAERLRLLLIRLRTGEDAALKNL